MPSGGQLGSGNGLQLQAATPGVADSGNAHVSGKIIADNGFSSQTNTNSNNTFQSLGLNTSQSGLGQGNIAVGNSTVVGGNESIAIGNSAKCYSAGYGGMVVGSQSVLGSAGTAAGGQIFGQQQNLSLGPGSTSGGVMLGYSNTSKGNCLVFGSGITILDNDHIVIGKNIDLPLGVKNNIIIGHQIGQILTSNTIKIGKSTHTQVNVGAYTIGQSTGLTSTMDDVDTVLTSNTGILQITSITAPRTVTLPMANTVQKGFEVKVVDFSGGCSGVNTITVGIQGGDNLQGGTVMNSAYAFQVYQSDGVSRWVRTN